MKKMHLSAEPEKHESPIVVLEATHFDDVADLNIFIDVLGCPEYTVGFEFFGNQIAVYSALSGAPRKYYVESPTACDSPVEYGPLDSVTDLLDAIEIDYSNGCFQPASCAFARSLREFEPDLLGEDVEVYSSLSELQKVVNELYKDVEW